MELYPPAHFNKLYSSTTPSELWLHDKISLAIFSGSKSVESARACLSASIFFNSVILVWILCSAWIFALSSFFYFEAESCLGIYSVRTEL